MAVVRRSKIVGCGLEVPKGVVYRGWEPGKEYTKPLVVKNVQLQSQRITYRSVYYPPQHHTSNAHGSCLDAELRVCVLIRLVLYCLAAIELPRWLSGRLCVS